MKTVEEALVTLAGMSPLMESNVRLADPENEYTVMIKQLTAKGSKMTAADREQKLLHQLRGSLYDDDWPLSYPTINILRSFQAGGSGLGSGRNSLGPSVERGVLMPELSIPLHYGTRRLNGKLEEVTHGSLDEFLDDKRFRDMRIVNGNPSGGKNKSMVPAMRPVFPEWELEITVRIFTDMISRQDFERVAAAGGNVGLGNGRKIQMGRYTAKVNWE